MPGLVLVLLAPRPLLADSVMQAINTKLWQCLLVRFAASLEMKTLDKLNDRLVLGVSQTRGHLSSLEMIPPLPLG